VLGGSLNRIGESPVGINIDPGSRALPAGPSPTFPEAFLKRRRNLVAKTGSVERVAGSKNEYKIESNGGYDLVLYNPEI